LAGIFLFNKLTEIADWKKSANFGAEAPSEGQGPDTYIAQHYISDPYLIGCRKFDLRLYVLVPSYQPLTVWLSRTGFARFSNHRFSMSGGDLKNAYVHLTNVAIQSNDPNFNAEVGCKWALHSLRQYMISQHGGEA
jgi:tubulin polyglutamylase TTLL9